MGFLAGDYPGNEECCEALCFDPEECFGDPCGHNSWLLKV